MCLCWVCGVYTWVRRNQIPWSWSCGSYEHLRWVLNNKPGSLTEQPALWALSHLSRPALCYLKISDSLPWKDIQTTWQSFCQPPKILRHCRLVDRFPGPGWVLKYFPGNSNPWQWRRETLSRKNLSLYWAGRKNMTAILFFHNCK